MIEVDWKDVVAKAATFVFMVVFPIYDVFIISHGDEEYDFL
jgi:hypothetical protein